MSHKKLTLNTNGIVVAKKNLPILPPLEVVDTTSTGKKLVRLHRLIRGDSPQICIRRGPGIGDMLMATPTIHFIALQYPHAEITVATDLDYLEGALPAVLKHNSDVYNIVEWNTNKEENYDVNINLHCPAIAHEKPHAEPINRIDLFANSIGIRLREHRPIYRFTSNELEEAYTFLESKMFVKPNDRVILVNPFASARGRGICPEKTKEIIKMLYQKNKNIKVFVLTHHSDYDKSSVWSCSDGVIKDLKVRSLAAISFLSNLLICPDSAMLHIAGALDIPCLALFGPTDARARVNYYPNTIGYWPAVKLTCSPCWFHYGNCSHNWYCWNVISPIDVADIALKKIANDSLLFKDFKKRQLRIPADMDRNVIKTVII